MTNVTLYGYPTSPYVTKVACYLKYKKIPFHFEAVNPITAKEIKFTSQRQIPVLKIGDEWRKDSAPLSKRVTLNFSSGSVRSSRD